MGLITENMQIMIAAVLIAGVAIPVTGASMVTQLKTVDNEVHSSTGSIPETFTVDHVEYGLVKDSETVTLEDSIDNTNYTLDSGEYKINYETGEINVTDGNLDGDAGQEINATSDTYYVDYKYKPTGYVGGMSAVFLPFVIVGLAIALLMAAFKPLLKNL